MVSFGKKVLRETVKGHVIITSDPSSFARKYVGALIIEVGELRKIIVFN